MNQSNYRSSEKGLVLERLSLCQEKGDSLLPYRVEIGDSFSDISYRTQSRPLQGMQLEFQPGLGLFAQPTAAAPPLAGSATRAAM